MRGEFPVGGWRDVGLAVSGYGPECVAPIPTQWPAREGWIWSWREHCQDALRGASDGQKGTGCRRERERGELPVLTRPQLLFPEAAAGSGVFAAGKVVTMIALPRAGAWNGRIRHCPARSGGRNRAVCAVARDAGVSGRVAAHACACRRRCYRRKHDLRRGRWR